MSVCDHGDSDGIYNYFIRSRLPNYDILESRHSPSRDRGLLPYDITEKEPNPVFLTLFRQAISMHWNHLLQDAVALSSAH